MPLDCEVIRRDGPQDRLLVFVHGYAEPTSMFTDHLGTVDPGGRYLVVAPLAPFERKGRRMWHRRLGSGEQEPADQFLESLARLTRFVERTCHHHHLDPAQTVATGFSQGAALALGLLLAESSLPPPAACAAFCGFAPPIPGLRIDRDRPGGVPVLLPVATDDDWIPLDLSRGTAHLLDELGASLDYHELAGGHTITEESAALAGSWLDALEAGAPRSGPLPPGTSAGVRRMVEPLWSW